MAQPIHRHAGVPAALDLTAEEVDALLRSHWSAWSECAAVINNPDPNTLRRWIGTAEAEQRQIVLRSLAHAASAKGDDDAAAARVLAWLMLGPACVLARKYRHHQDADHHVAALLWLEIKQYTPGCARDVWAYLVSRLRKAMFAELMPEPELSLGEEEMNIATVAQESDMDALLGILTRGVRNGAITTEDELLILDVLTASASVTTAEAGGSLLGDRVSNVVGVSLGLSGRTVRRRVRRSIDALAVSHIEWRQSA